MLPSLQLTLIDRTVAPEDISVFGDGIASGPLCIPICLQILISVFSPGRRLISWDPVPLDEEEFGLAHQGSTPSSCKKTFDSVQIQTEGIRVGAEDFTFCATADNTTGEAVTILDLLHFQCLGESCQNFSNTQPPVEDHLEVKSLKGLLQHFCMKREKNSYKLCCKNERACYYYMIGIISLFLLMIEKFFQVFFLSFFFLQYYT